MPAQPPHTTDLSAALGGAVRDYVNLRTALLDSNVGTGVILEYPRATFQLQLAQPARQPQL